MSTDTDAPVMQSNTDAPVMSNTDAPPIRSNTDGLNELLQKIAEEFYANNGFDVCSNVVLQLDRALNQGDRAKTLLYAFANELDEWHYNSSIVKVSAASAGIGGAITGTYTDAWWIYVLL